MSSAATIKKEEKDNKNMSKKQPNQVRNYQKGQSSSPSHSPIQRKTIPNLNNKPGDLKGQKLSSTSSTGRLPQTLNEDEIQNKRKIMEYLKIVKEKSALWATKLEEATKEAQYFKMKSKELEESRDKVIEREKVMAMKYGIIFSQNKELMNKLLKRKQENTELKQQLTEHRRKESMPESMTNDIFTRRMNSTIHRRDDSSPIGKRVMPTSYSTSSFLTTYNPAEAEAIDKYV